MMRRGLLILASLLFPLGGEGRAEPPAADGARGTGVSAGADPKAKDAGPADGAASAMAASNAAVRDVVERLKSIRTEIVLEEERVRLLKIRLERLELEAKLAAVEGPKGTPVVEKPKDPEAPKPEAAPKKPRKAQAAAPVGEAKGEPEPAAELVVKALTMRPFKEAIVSFRGKVYTVRPGDSIGPIDIRDITEAGVLAAGRGASRTVLVGR